MDENNLFLENSSVNILDILNTIPDKGMTAWKEKLNGHKEISSEEAKALMDSMKKKSDSVAQECRQKAKDIWITQKCAEILKSTFKTDDYAARTAAGLADLAGMCEDGKDFKEIIKVVDGPVILNTCSRLTIMLQEQQQDWQI